MLKIRYLKLDLLGVFIYEYFIEQSFGCAVILLDYYSKTIMIFTKQRKTCSKMYNNHIRLLTRTFENLNYVQISYIFFILLKPIYFDI